MLVYYREGLDLLSIWDIILPPIYLFIIVSYAFIVKSQKVEKKPEYKYYTTGLLLKILGGLTFASIYLFYYGGGDTTLYFQSAESLLNLATTDFSKYFSIMLGHLTPENASLFGPEIGYNYYYRDFQSYSVVRFSSIFVFLAGRSYITSTILISAFTFIGPWSLFKLLYNKFSLNKKTIIFSVLLIPSCLFWGSGLLKDSYTLMATCLLLVSFYNIVILKRKVFKNILLMIFSSYILLSLKPYIFFAMIGAFIISLIHRNIAVIKNSILRTTVVPILILVIAIGGSMLMLKIGETIGGHYASLENMLEKAAINQQDLKQSYYGGNSFDIGTFEPTIPGIMSKMHLAILAGLYRPYLWDSRNPVMLISAMENSIFLFLTIYVILLSFLTWREHGWKYMQKILFSDSYIVFSISFSVIFAFFIGLTTANFGALVRYKIPLIPFFMTSLFFIVHNFNIERDKSKKN